MPEYIVTLDHFKFSKDGDTLVVESWRDTDFLVEFDWPDDLSVDDENEVHERFYLEARSAYNESE